MTRGGAARPALLALIALASTAALSGSSPAAGGGARQISGSGGFGDVGAPALAADAAHGRQLAVWVESRRADYPPHESEVFGRVLDPSGRPLGRQVRISRMGPDGDKTYQALSPSVAYNPRRGEYLVVWLGNGSGEARRPCAEAGQFPGAESCVKTDREVFARRVDRRGRPIGRQHRVTNTGPRNSTQHHAQGPQLVYQRRVGRYLLVFTVPPLFETDSKVLAQLLDGRGRASGKPRSVSRPGIPPKSTPDLPPPSPAEPHLAYNSRRNETLVAYLRFGETGWEIDGQRLAPSGRRRGPLLILAAGFRHSPRAPYLAASPVTGRYLLTYVQPARGRRYPGFDSDLRTKALLPDGSPDGRSTALRQRDSVPPRLTAAADPRSGGYVTAWSARNALVALSHGRNGRARGRRPTRLGQDGADVALGAGRAGVLAVWSRRPTGRAQRELYSRRVRP